MTNVLEIIELRSIKKNKLKVLELVDRLVANNSDNIDLEIKIYTHTSIDTDFSIHLYYLSDDSQEFGSKLGYKLTSDLKEFGLVNHNIWIDRNS